MRSGGPIDVVLGDAREKHRVERRLSFDHAGGLHRRVVAGHLNRVVVSQRPDQNVLERQRNLLLSMDLIDPCEHPGKVLGFRLVTTLLRLLQLALGAARKRGRIGQMRLDPIRGDRVAGRSTLGSHPNRQHPHTQNIDHKRCRKALSHSGYRFRRASRAAHRSEGWNAARTNRRDRRGRAALTSQRTL